MALALCDNAYHTYADYLAWPEDVRYELIDGRAHLMAPAPTLEHQDIAGEIYFQLRHALEGKPCRAFIAPVDVRLPKGEDLDEGMKRSTRWCSRMCWSYVMRGSSIDAAYAALPISSWKCSRPPARATITCRSATPTSELV